MHLVYTVEVLARLGRLLPERRGPKRRTTPTPVRCRGWSALGNGPPGGMQAREGRGQVDCVELDFGNVIN